jgi:hypothetical protein
MIAGAAMLLNVAQPALMKAGFYPLDSPLEKQGRTVEDMYRQTGDVIPRIIEDQVLRCQERIAEAVLQCQESKPKPKKSRR